MHYFNCFILFVRQVNAIHKLQKGYRASAPASAALCLSVEPGDGRCRDPAEKSKAETLARRPCHIERIWKADPHTAGQKRADCKGMRGLCPEAQSDGTVRKFMTANIACGPCTAGQSVVG